VVLLMRPQSERDGSSWPEAESLKRNNFVRKRACICRDRHIVGSAVHVFLPFTSGSDDSFTLATDRD
jgi:hypothetical protein